MPSIVSLEMQQTKGEEKKVVEGEVETGPGQKSEGPDTPNRSKKRRLPLDQFGIDVVTKKQKQTNTNSSPKRPRGRPRKNIDEKNGDNRVEKSGDKEVPKRKSRRLDHQTLKPPVLKVKHFTDEEKKAIDEVVEQYTKEHGITRQEFAVTLHAVGLRPQGTKGTGFWTEIAKVLPGRKRPAYIAYVKRTYSPYEKRAWTEEEDKVLERLQELHKGSWKTIGALMERRSDEVCDRWRNHVRPRTKSHVLQAGRWSEEEDAKLLESIKDAYIKAGDNETAKDVFAKQTLPVSLTVLSEQYFSGTRTRQAISQRWDLLYAAKHGIRTLNQSYEERMTKRRARQGEPRRPRGRPHGSKGRKGAGSNISEEVLDDSDVEFENLVSSYGRESNGEPEDLSTAGWTEEKEGKLKRTIVRALKRGVQPDELELELLNEMLPGDPTHFTREQFLAKWGDIKAAMTDDERAEVENAGGTKSGDAHEAGTLNTVEPEVGGEAKDKGEGPLSIEDLKPEPDDAVGGSSQAEEPIESRQINPTKLSKKHRRKVYDIASHSLSMTPEIGPSSIAWESIASQIDEEQELSSEACKAAFLKEAKKRANPWDWIWLLTEVEKYAEYRKEDLDWEQISESLNENEVFRKPKTLKSAFKKLAEKVEGYQEMNIGQTIERLVNIIEQNAA